MSLDYILDDYIVKLKEIINENYLTIANLDISIAKDKTVKGHIAYNAIMNIVNRIEKIIVHLNQSVENIYQKKDVFDLYDFLNQGQTLIDSIYKLAYIFRTNMHELRNKIDIFNELGNDNTGNDDIYFKYIRSLLSVHPFDTTYYKAYQTFENEWCLDVREVFGFDKLDIETDFIATIASSDLVHTKQFYISTDKLLRFINRKVDFLSEIIKSILYFSENRINFLQNRIIYEYNPKNDINVYLDNLMKESFLRIGNVVDVLFFKLVFQTEFKDQNYIYLHEKYKKKVFEDIKKFKDFLQTQILVKSDYIPDSELIELIDLKKESSNRNVFIIDILNKINNIESKENIKEKIVEILKNSKYKLTDVDKFLIKLKKREIQTNRIVKINYNLDNEKLYLLYKILGFIEEQKR